MTPEQEENLEGISEEIGSVMYHVEMSWPHIGWALTELRALKWNNMNQPWHEALVSNLEEAQRIMKGISSQLSNIKLDETNCD